VQELALGHPEAEGVALVEGRGRDNGHAELHREAHQTQSPLDVHGALLLVVQKSHLHGPAGTDGGRVTWQQSIQ
jgi:hypothetical protein